MLNLFWRCSKKLIDLISDFGTCAGGEKEPFSSIRPHFSSPPFRSPPNRPRLHRRSAPSRERLDGRHHTYGEGEGACSLLVLAGDISFFPACLSSSVTGLQGWHIVRGTYPVVFSQEKMARLKSSRKNKKLRPRNPVQITNEEADNGDEQTIVTHVKRKKLFQRASPMKLVRLYSSMSTQQKELIRRAEFSGMVDIKCSKFQPELCKFLMESFNPTTCKLVFPGRGSIPVTEDSVYTVLGVPWGTVDVSYELDADSISFMMEQFAHQGSKQPTLASIEKKLAAMKQADSTYLRMWTVYAMCSVLAPTTAIHVSPRIYPSLVNIKQVNNLNVCKFVIRMLRKAAKSSAEKGILKACMLYFMVKYLDSLELKDLDVTNEGTRVSVWTNTMINKAISQDLKSDGTFGMAPLKAEFVNPEAVLRNTDAEIANEEADSAKNVTVLATIEEELADDHTDFANNETQLRPRNPVQIINEEAENGDEQTIVSHVKRKKLFQHASPMKLVRLYSSMSTHQKELIRGAEFSGMVDIKCSKLQPELCKFLMESFNPTTCELVFPGRGSIPITEESVYTVLGLPWGTIDVSYELDADSISFMMEQFAHQGSKQPTMTSIEKKLVAMKQADSTYLRMWTVYAMCSVLAPTTGIRVSPRIYPSLVNIKQVNNLNVCKFVIRMLRKAAKSSAEKGILKACMLYFMVKYLDSLELKDLDVTNEGTRVSVWTNAMVNKAISQDLKSDGTFGMAPLKAEFANPGAVLRNTDAEIAVEETDSANNETVLPITEEELADDHTDFTNNETQFARTETESRNTAVPHEEQQTFEQSILFSDPHTFRIFVEMNAPAGCTLEEKSRYTEAVQEACYGFETGLHNMFKTLTRRSAEQNFKQKKQDRHPVAKRRKSTIKYSQQEEDSIPMTESESNDNSDADYTPENEQHARNDSTVSLEDESFDFGGSCSHKVHETDEGLTQRYNRKAKAAAVQTMSPSLQSNTSGLHEAAEILAKLSETF